MLQWACLDHVLGLRFAVLVKIREFLALFNQTRISSLGKLFCAPMKPILVQKNNESLRVSITHQWAFLTSNYPTFWKIRKAFSFIDWKSIFNPKFLLILKYFILKKQALFGKSHFANGRTDSVTILDLCALKTL